MIGNKLGSFVLDTFEPGEGGEDLPAASVWNAYRLWCDKEGLVKLSAPSFFEAFDEVASEIGLERYQRGWQVYYLATRFKERLSV